MKIKLFVIAAAFAAFLFTGCESDSGSGDNNATPAPKAP